MTSVATIPDTPTGGGWRGQEGIVGVSQPGVSRPLIGIDARLQPRRHLAG